jgi:hypothetical protein
MTSESTTITLQLEPGGPGGSELMLRVSPEYEAELAELLQEAGIYGGSAVEFPRLPLSYRSCWPLSHPEGH